MATTHTPSPDQQALARRNWITLAILMGVVLGSASLAYFCREALFPVFFKY